MNTTLNPKPTDRERKMLAEWAGRFATITMQDGGATLKYTLANAVVMAESLLREFRAHYGVTGAEVEVEEPAPIRDPDDITLMEAIRMLPHDKTMTIYDSDCMGVITHDSGVGEWPFNSISELLAILKGGKSE